MVEDFKEKFREFLETEDLKFTSEREAILEKIFSIHYHFDADDLVFMLRGGKKRVSKATVYRTLDLLVKSNLIIEHQLGDKKKIYEHVLGHSHHDHLICLYCSKTIEFDEPMIEDFQDRVCEKLKFIPERHSLKIFGKCQFCQKKANRK
ncbi:MAG: transcriptional repressor [Candidatus Schekmanbacteria bacterium RBG_16_38_11]|uniref:Transcriptional repressor n=1 Tax=Candidatus Schekmanbacteria bacterium RBG_16_38_11 TaxID=1817880 RepID=A0A1F7RR03_9BACT|nr:MAG: transcriptional repressor [Candidatus Schekmanbacteria bacterium RBG_16_38_11]